jgi:CheY-like chemotaxis protein
MLQILAGEDIQFELSLHPDECLVAMESSRLEQILMNLVANSRDAMPNGGMVRISTGLVGAGDQIAIRHLGLKPAEYVSLRVADTGHGISEEIQPHIFEPFFSTKEEGKGSGLGLSTVYAIVRQHDGSITCNSAVGEGAEFTIYMPAAEQAPTAPVPDSGLQIRRRGSETILLVEDQSALRASIHRILERNGYSVVAAADGAEALKASETHDGFDLLVTDIALPKVRGTELARQLLDKYPRLRVLYMSGYSRERVPSDGAHFIPKPFKRDALIRKIREVLDA